MASYVFQKFTIDGKDYTNPQVTVPITKDTEVTATYVEGLPPKPNILGLLGPVLVGGVVALMGEEEEKKNK